MSLLSRLPVTRTPLRFVSAKRLSFQSGLRDVRQTVEPLPWRGHLRNEKAKNVLRDIETATVSQARSAWIYTQSFISSSTVGTLPRGDNKTEVSMPGPTGQWMPNIYQRERLPDGLFGCGGHTIPARLKHCLGPWSPSYAGLHLVPARNYCIPMQVKPIPVPRNNPLGNTFTMDLGPEDQVKLQKIAYDKLKAHLKSHKVSYKKRGKINQEGREPRTDLFGESLDLTASKDLQAQKIPKDFQVPRFIRLLLEKIKEKGHLKDQVFMKLGNPNTMAKLLKHVVSNLPNKDCVLPDDSELHDIGQMTLNYFDKLPVPLMATDKIDVYPYLTDLKFDPDQIKALHLFILSMTQPHRDTLHLLMTTLHHLTQHRTTTKLDIETVGQKFGPFIFRLSPKAGPEETALRNIDWVYLTKLMVYNPMMMFHVDTETMELLRSPTKSKFPWGIGKKKEQNIKAISGDFNLPISAPTFPKTSLKVKTDATTKVEDVIFTYTTICTNSHGGVPDSQWEYCLFEVGGNIGERCLDENALIQQVYQVNPQAEFVIKEKYGRKKVETAEAQP